MHCTSKSSIQLCVASSGVLSSVSVVVVVARCCQGGACPRQFETAAFLFLTSSQINSDPLYLQ